MPAMPHMRMFYPGCGGVVVLTYLAWDQFTLHDRGQEFPGQRIEQVPESPDGDCLKSRDLEVTLCQQSHEPTDGHLVQSALDLRKPRGDAGFVFGPPSHQRALCDD